MSEFSHRYAIETNLKQNVAKKKSFITESSKLAKLRIKVSTNLQKKVRDRARCMGEFWIISIIFKFLDSAI